MISITFYSLLSLSLNLCDLHSCLILFAPTRLKFPTLVPYGFDFIRGKGYYWKRPVKLYDLSLSVTLYLFILDLFYCYLRSKSCTNENEKREKILSLAEISLRSQGKDLSHSAHFTLSSLTVKAELQFT